MKKLKPEFWYDSIYDIDFKQMYNDGIRALFFDIDNTMEGYDQTEPSEKLLEFTESLQEMGFRVAVLSNAKAGRSEYFAKKMQVDFEGHALKPKLKGFRNLAERIGVKPSEVAMIGDQLFTDIWGANRFGCRSILVTPIDLDGDPGFVKFKRVFEQPIIKKCSKTKGK